MNEQQIKLADHILALPVNDFVELQVCNNGHVLHDEPEIDTAVIQSIVREWGDLRSELIDQWIMNHAEHCGSHIPVGSVICPDVDTHCGWPLPAILAKPASLT
jgi:hypothetical protein